MNTFQFSSTDEHLMLPLPEKEKLKTKSHTINRYTMPKVKVFTVEPRKFFCEPSHFRSVVQYLTGLSGNDTNPKFAQLTFLSKAYQDMLECVSSLKMLENSRSISQECIDCLVYSRLFPKNHEIDRETLVQLWMAEGLIKEEPMEDIAASYVRALVDNGEYISFFRKDYGTSKIWYKINGFQIPQQVLERSNIIPVRVISDYPAETDQVHVILQRLLTKDLQPLGKFTKMRSLLLSRNHRSNVERLPYDFFMTLENLRALDLSRTKISELPSSIGNVKSLRYLDLSETLIKRLPETMEFLENLQTLKLQNCPRLVSLPKSTTRLTRLRHLDLGTLRRIHCMPAGMGALTSLRTLSEFVVGTENGCRIGELQKMNDLEGKLCLLNLENVASIDDARDANLSHKLRLKNLELRWTDEDVREEGKRFIDKVVEYLQPHTNLQDLRVLCFRGSVLPSWVSHPSFVKLTKITLFKCANCQSLPYLGQLPSLESLSLIEFTSVRVINNRCRKDMRSAAQVAPATDPENHFVAFPKLQQLQIKSMLNLEHWKCVRYYDFPYLRKLSIKDCPKIAALCKLGNMTSLEELELNKCTKLVALPEEELPASLTTLVIDGCPLFNLSCSGEKKHGWVQIQPSPSLLIYQREMKKYQGRILDPPQQAGSLMATSDAQELLFTPTETL